MTLSKSSPGSLSPAGGRTTGVALMASSTPEKGAMYCTPEKSTTGSSSATMPGPTVGSPTVLLNLKEAAVGPTLCPKGIDIASTVMLTSGVMATLYVTHSYLMSANDYHVFGEVKLSAKKSSYGSKTDAVRVSTSVGLANSVSSTSVVNLSHGTIGIDITEGV